MPTNRDDPSKASGTIPPPNQIKPPALPAAPMAPTPEPTVVVQTSAASPPAPTVVVQTSAAASPPAPAAPAAAALEPDRRATQPPPTRKGRASGDPRPWINPNARWQDFKPWRS